MRLLPFFPLETFHGWTESSESWFWRGLGRPSSQRLVFYLKAAFSFLPTLASWCWFLSGQLDLSPPSCQSFLGIFPGRITVVMGSAACLHSHLIRQINQTTIPAKLWRSWVAFWHLVRTGSMLTCYYYYYLSFEENLQASFRKRSCCHLWMAVN